MTPRENHSFEWPRFAFAAILLLLATGCQVANGGLTRRGDIIFQNRLVAIPSLELDSNTSLGTIPRLKVAKLNITAPRKRQKLAENHASQDVFSGLAIAGASRQYGVIYWLKDDAVGLIEDSLGYIFEIDSSSNLTVNATAKLDFTNYYTYDSLCSFWDTTTKISLSIEIITDGKSTREKNYQSAVKETYCAAMQMHYWLHEDFITANMRIALHAVIEEMLQDLRSGKLAGGENGTRVLN